PFRLEHAQGFSQRRAGDLELLQELGFQRQLVTRIQLSTGDLGSEVSCDNVPELLGSDGSDISHFGALRIARRASTDTYYTTLTMFARPCILSAWRRMHKPLNQREFFSCLSL